MLVLQDKALFELFALLKFLHYAVNTKKPLNYFVLIQVSIVLYWKLAAHPVEVTSAPAL